MPTPLGHRSSMVAMRYALCIVRFDAEVGRFPMAIRAWRYSSRSPLSPVWLCRWAIGCFLPDKIKNIIRINFSKWQQKVSKWFDTFRSSISLSFSFTVWPPYVSMPWSFLCNALISSRCLALALAHASIASSCSLFNNLKCCCNEVNFKFVSRRFFSLSSFCSFTWLSIAACARWLEFRSAFNDREASAKIKQNTTQCIVQWKASDKMTKYLQADCRAAFVPVHIASPVVCNVKQTKSSALFSCFTQKQLARNSIYFIYSPELIQLLLWTLEYCHEAHG